MAHALRRVALHVFLPLALLACSAEPSRAEPPILGTWTLEKVVYDDGSENVLDPGNYVEIGPEDIIEIIAGAGSRRYSYVREGRTLNLQTGSGRIAWRILERRKDELTIQTPIGRYVLKISSTNRERAREPG